MQTHTLNQTSLLLWPHATARTRRQNYRQKIRRAWTSDHSSSVQSNSPGTPSTLNTHVCSNTNSRLQSVYSVMQESVSDLATPVNLMRQFTGHKRIRLHTRRQLLSNCPSPLGHSLSRCISRMPTHWETGRLGVWLCLQGLCSCWPRCASRVVHSRVRCMQGICSPADRKWR